MSKQNAIPVEDAITEEAKELLDSERTLTLEVRELENELRQVDPRFQKFIEKQAELKVLQSQNADAWKEIEKQMIELNIKSVKGDWGSITIAERLNWRIDQEVLPPRFWKKVPDTTKISTIFRLEGKAPKGANLSYTQYLTKRIKVDK